MQAILKLPRAGDSFLEIYSTHLDGTTEVGPFLNEHFQCIVIK